MKAKGAGSRGQALEPQAREFYLQTMRVLWEAGIDHLVGGAYALAHHVGIVRNTKDFDLFLRPRDVPRAMERLAAAGFRAELASPLWLAKALRPGGEEYVDLIFNSGNGQCPMDEWWFERAVQGLALDEPAKLIPVEAMIWTKAFIQERERFDGADIAHLLLVRGRELDWQHLTRLFAGHEQVLLAHLIMFTYIYPSERDAVPQGTIEALTDKMRSQPPDEARICRGTNLSRAQYLVDVRAWDFADARIGPIGPLTAEQVAELTGSVDADATLRMWPEAQRPPRTQAPRRRRLGKTG